MEVREVLLVCGFSVVPSVVVPDPDPESEQQEAESEQQEALVSQLGSCGRSCEFEGDSSAREAPLLVSFVLVSGTALALAIHLVEATTDSIAILSLPTRTRDDSYICRLVLIASRYVN